MLISGSQKFLKNLNRLAVLQELRRRPGSSRVELAAELALTKTTIGQLVDELLVEGWLVEERSRPSRGMGRRPTPLYLDGTRNMLLGADLTPERLIVLATSLTGELRELSVTLTSSPDPNTVLDALAAQLSVMAQRMSSAGGRVCGVGVGVPGMVTTEEGVVRMDRDGWNDLPLRAMLRGRLAERGFAELPLLVERAVGCSALHHFEFEFEATAAEAPRMYVQVGTEVSLVVACSRGLLRGRHGMAGAVGHTCLDPAGPRCSCGRSGCLDMLVTMRAIERESGKTPGEIRTLAALGDAMALDVLRRVGERLGVALFNQCLMHDPARVLVGGPAFQLGGAYVQSAQHSLNALFAEGGRQAPRIQVMRYDAHDIALGAATRVMYSLVNIAG